MILITEPQVSDLLEKTPKLGELIAESPQLLAAHGGEISIFGCPSKRFEKRPIYILVARAAWRDDRDSKGRQRLRRPGMYDLYILDRERSVPGTPSMLLWRANQMPQALPFLLTQLAEEQSWPLDSTVELMGNVYGRPKEEVRPVLDLGFFLTRLVHAERLRQSRTADRGVRA